MLASGAVAALLLACGRSGGVGQGMSTRTAADTVAGVLSEQGADPATRLVITPADGPARILTGDSAAALRSVVGADVWVRGEPRGDDFVVAEFTVRAVNGVAVDDGVVTRAATGLELVMRSGARRPLPAELGRAVGERVWVSRPDPGRAPSFGVIR